MDRRKVQAMTTLFIAYGKQAETERIALYCKAFNDVPAEILQKIVEKSINECEYLPSVARLREAGRSLIGSIDVTQRVKPWVEAQQEIQHGLSRVWYRGCMGEIPEDDPNYGLPCDPMWTTPEIKAAVDSYGFDNLQMAMASDMPIVWAQIRKAYEQACETKKEREVNTHVLAGTELKQLVGSIGLIKQRRT
jgi:hypothetical protein